MAIESEVSVISRDFMQCVSTWGDIGKDGRGLGWYKMHPELWCFMSGYKDDSRYIYGIVTLGEDGWIARVGDKCGTKYGTKEKAMRDVESLVSYEASRI